MSAEPDRSVASVTQVLYGVENAEKLFSRLVRGADTVIDICDDDIISHTAASFKIIEERVLEAGAKFRYITEIKKDNIKYCKELMKVGQVRHLDGIRINFVVTDTEYTSSAIMQQVHAHPEIVYSNVRSIVEQQQYLFENLWSKAIPAERRINEIEEGIELEKTHVIEDPHNIQNLFVDLVRSARHEVLLILPTVNAFLREDRIGVIRLLMQAVIDHKVNVRILTPTSDVIDNILKNEVVSHHGGERMKDFDIRSINRSPEETSLSTVTIMVVDKKESLVFEKTDDTKENFIEAVGMATHSNSKPTVLSYISIFESLWKQVDLYEQLKTHDKMQKEFINIASHEMKTPTQAIIGYADLIHKHPEKREDMMQSISRNAVRLQRLTNDILDVTRIDSRTLNLHKEQFDISDLIETIVQDHLGHIEKENQNVKLFYNFGQDINDTLPVDADRDRIGQVISNLMSNAIKFTTRKNGIISVYAERKEKEAIVSIRDTGEGISPEIIPRLFTKFATRSFSGTGLGLYISKNIVEAHGGKMWAENNPEGEGATFTFTLPLSSRKTITISRKDGGY
jgi:two-component system, OmpR family, sensor histidine kinase VicK